MQTEAFTNSAFEPVTVHRTTHLFFRNHQAQAGVIQFIATNQQEKPWLAYLERSAIEYGLEVGRPQQA